MGWRGVFLTFCLVPACGEEDPSDTDVAALEAAEGTLRVLTYNVHGLPPGITGDDTPGRMTQIGPKLADRWDVIGLQEDFDETNHATLRDLAAYPHVDRFGEPVDSSRAYGAGLSMLSTVAIDDALQEFFDDCNGTLDGASDCLASKGFHAVRLTLAPGVEVDVYNSHLEAGNGAADDAAREGHVNQLIAAMNGWSANHPVIFLGDTNLHGDDPQDAPLMERWLQETQLVDVCDAIGCDQPGRIDRVLIRPLAATAQGSVTLSASRWGVATGFIDAEREPLSDHQAIEADVTWTFQPSVDAE